MTLHIAFDNSYARLPGRFYAQVPPEPAPAPAPLAVNRALAGELGIDPDALETPEGTALLAGNGLPDGAAGIATVYAAHQFGNWVPQLGDGRALMWGEVVTGKGRFDIQLKGAGRTPFSRSGDGRAWIGPVIREYLVSEAMHALGVPTTRALAAVRTGGIVHRGAALPGAVLARVASSHIRVGTFQYFAARQDDEALAALTEHVIARHYPQADGPLALLREVTAAQARLIAHWMALGFIHGVMNTDNMAVSGETIDYGPCAFMDGYDPGKVFSSIDHGGRYAYANQPQIAAWNLAQLASSLLPLMGDREAAIAEATEAVNGFIPAYQGEWLARFGAKIGLTDATEDDVPLITGLLEMMAKGGSDFTNTFRALARGEARDHIADRAAFDAWHARWRDRAGDGAEAVMLAANPALIPRNHRIEQAIAAAVEGDDAPFHRLHKALATPYAEPGDAAELTRPPVPEEEVTQTFCGT